MKNILGALLGVIILFLFLTFTGAFYALPETEQAVITRFGKPVGDPVTTAGLHFKLPFIDKVNHLEKRVLSWDGTPREMPTRDKLYIIVDPFGRWRISDPLRFFVRLSDLRSADSRLDDIVGGEIRNTVARRDLVELIRTTKGRKPEQDTEIAVVLGAASALPDIELGREKLEEEVAKLARPKLLELGIELLDVRFKRIDYNPAVASKIYDRMISERRQIAERFRSEGAGEAARILGTRERDTRQIESEAYEKVQAIQGKADADAITIYAKAYNQTPEAREFYAFQRSLDAYRTGLQQNTTLVLTTDDPFLKYLRGLDGDKQDKTPQNAGQDNKPANANAQDNKQGGTPQQ